MMVMIIATILICALFTILEIAGTKKNPIFGLHNLPRDIQVRVQSLSEFKGKSPEILSTKERIIKKLPAVIVVFLVFAGIVYGAGARTFLQGFGYSLGLWIVVKLYVTLVLTCGWYAHTSSVWIRGTEDMKASYQNYGFYLSSIPRSILTGTIVALSIGGIIVVAGTIC